MDGTELCGRRTVVENGGSLHPTRATRSELDDDDDDDDDEFIRGVQCGD